MLIERIPPRLRATFVLLTVIAVAICKWPFWLFLVWLFLLIPISFYAGVSRAHLTLCASFLLPIGIGLMVIWGLIVGAPPGAMPRSNPTAGALYALTLLGRLMVFSAVIQILYLALSPQHLVDQLRGLGLRNDLLLVTLGALAILPEVRMRAVHVYDAGRARGFLHQDSLSKRVRMVPYILRGLFSWTIRSAIDRSRLWQERGIVQEHRLIVENVSRSSHCRLEALQGGPSLAAVVGLNFSGRTAMLRTLSGTPGSRYLGPEIYSFLSGLSLTVQDELELNFPKHEEVTNLVDDLEIRHLLSRNPLTLSGGEQASVVVASALASCTATLCVDCTLEQLDVSRKRRLLQLLRDNPILGNSSLLADNRMDELLEMKALDRVLPPSTTVIENPLDVRPVTAIRENHHKCDPCTIQVTDLAFSYKRNVPILSNCSFSLEPGSVYCLEGKNGAGKSTLSRILAGLLKPSRPCFLVNGEPTPLWKSAGSIFCYHYQNPDAQLFATSIREELAMAPNEFKLAKFDELVDDVAECFGLSGILDEHPSDLPFVLRKRVALAACFTSGRPWIILDEPTLGQDDLTCRSLADTVRKLVQKQVGFLIISHSRHFVDMLPSRTLRLQNGAIEVD